MTAELLDKYLANLIVKYRANILIGFAHHQTVTNQLDLITLLQIVSQMSVMLQL